MRGDYLKVERLIKSVFVIFIVFGLLTVLLATIFANIYHSFNESFLFDMQRTAEMVRISDNNIITFEDLVYLKDEAGVDKVSGYSEIVAKVSNKLGIYSDGIKIALVDEDYASIYKHELLMGNFPDTDAVKKGKAYAVISDQLALKLFMSLDIVGNEIELLSRKYIVAGVYKRRNSILWSLCGDGYDRVFIPYTSIGNHSEMPVDIVALLKIADQSMYDIKAKLETIIENKMPSYKIIDHLASDAVSRQYFDLLIFIIGMAAIFYSVMFSIKYTMSTIRLFKEKANSYYISSLLRVDVRRVISNLSVIIICCAGVVFIANAIRFKFFIADKYIPDDNIFDLKFYIGAAVKDIMISNAYKINVYSLFEHYYRNILHIEIYCTLLITTLFIASHEIYKLLLYFDLKLKYLLLSVLSVILAGGAAGVLIAILLGLNTFFPIKVWTIILYYFMVLAFLRSTSETMSI